MIAPGKKVRLLIMDACVLIDFLKADRTVLHLTAGYVGPIHVVSPIVEEVREINDQEDLVALGLSVIEPEMEDAYTAASNTGTLHNYAIDWKCVVKWPMDLFDFSSSSAIFSSLYSMTFT